MFPNGDNCFAIAAHVSDVSGTANSGLKSAHDSAKLSNSIKEGIRLTQPCHCLTPELRTTPIAMRGSLYAFVDSRVRVIYDFGIGTTTSSLISLSLSWVGATGLARLSDMSVTQSDDDDDADDLDGRISFQSTRRRPVARSL